MDNKTSILNTVRYSDLFDFPVTKEEIWQFLIAKRPMTMSRFSLTLRRMVGKELSYTSSYYCLKGRERIISTRKKRQRASERKMYQAKRLAPWFSLFPTVRYVGISGSLARMNADTHDDIDLFIITEVKTVWITRLLLLGFLQLMGRRRKRGERFVKDKICLNFLLDVAFAAFPLDRHDLYTAYEIAQLTSLFNRSNTYDQFLHRNVWIRDYLPNVPLSRSVSTEGENVFFQVVCLFFSFLEPFARTFQLWIIKRHKTTEITTNGIAAFHPRDYRKQVLRRFAHLASENTLEASKNEFLWGIDKHTPIIYTRKDCTVSPDIPLERLCFNIYE